MASRIPDVVIIPDSNAKKLYGIEPVIITRDDMVSITGWYKLAVNHDMFLDEKEFKNRDLFTKYWLVSMGMTEYPFMIFYGQEGGGKSMGMAVTAHRLINHFGRKATMDFTPPEGEYYRPFNPVVKRQQSIEMLKQIGDPQNLIPKLEAEIKEIRKVPPFFNFYDEDFVDKITNELDRLQRLEKELTSKGEKVPDEEYQKLIIYNAVFALDEGDSYGDVQTQTHLISVIGRIGRRRRHTHTTILMAYVDLADVPTRQILNRATHHVMCAKNWVYEGYCSYRVKDVRPGGSGETKFMHLKPEECTRLWNSHNLVSISHDVEIHFGNEAAKKKKADREKALAKKESE
jgi:hypothetical protein